MKIGELSQITGVSVRSLRHYEQKQLIHSKRMENGYRSFEKSMIDRVKTVQIYLSLGLNTDQIREIMQCRVQNEELTEEQYCEDLANTYISKLKDINDQIYSLQSIKQKLEEKMNEYNLIDH